MHNNPMFMTFLILQGGKSKLKTWLRSPEAPEVSRESLRLMMCGLLGVHIEDAKLDTRNDCHTFMDSKSLQTIYTRNSRNLTDY